MIYLPTPGMRFRTIDTMVVRTNADTDVMVISTGVEGLVSEGRMVRKRLQMDHHIPSHV